ncbi:hypothetical protein [Ensifer adhaerens]|uniref:hypothetical protein n=1 Tax=Ensifer adhaerens TaxID=106592 RepID=UPI000FD9BAC5|nr:hypothetical protein [Ensifer adhaerens]MDF8353222.1 hypothetical protein [Ensifer adhaerens]THA67983.1 hypothetical protein E5176_07565 [Ensifer adhaerens]
MAKTEAFFTEQQIEAKCVVCGADFLTQAKNPRSACSDTCKRTRALRYGAAYRQHGREIRQKLFDMLGGRKPTGEEIMKLIQLRKGTSQ